MTTYGSGLRINEACRLQVEDIDSRRMLIHIRHGKGDRDRYVTLPERVLFTLRRYWVFERPNGSELFPGQKPGSCVSDSAVRENLHAAAENRTVASATHGFVKIRHYGLMAAGNVNTKLAAGFAVSAARM